MESEEFHIQVGRSFLALRREEMGIMKRARFKRALVAFVAVLAVSLFSAGVALADGQSAQTGASSSGNSAASQMGADVISDPSTIWDWDRLISQDTSNVGRIWTDKTVSTGDMSQNGISVKKAEGGDFLTALTALSSTSNLSTMSTVPLDIVLVLDASGSMDDPMGSGDRTARIAALRSAANAFIDAIAAQNEGISDAAKQHQVSLVKFAGNKTSIVGNDTYQSGGYTYNYSQVMKNMAVCAQDTKASFKSLVNAIDPSGATNSQAGLELAQGQASGRGDAKKVVIFFTDGTPTTASEFSSSVASGAVTAAKTMKDAGATVYSIGIFSGADPATSPTAKGASNENKFMHAVSSNYPDATYAQSGGWESYKWSFGERAKDSSGADAAFYKSAANAKELEKIFDDISKEITSGAGYPTSTTEGYESESGYIVFDDQLGNYMQVTDLSTIVYDGQPYTKPSKTTEGNVDTYRFSGEVNSGAAEANLSDMVITVTHASDALTGDTVQVKIPATLIPLRHFNVDLAKDTMTVDETTPVSVFYTSALKSEVAGLLEQPDAAMKAYIVANADAKTGKVNFYANKWNGGSMGDTTATFEPSAANRYYYFTEDTPIYMDEACTQRASSVEGGNTYYYVHSYYSKVGNKPVATSDVHTFPGDKAAAFAGAIGVNDDGAYFKMGTARLVYINELKSEKVRNETDTATDVLNPKWNSEDQVSAATQVAAHLGNNGKVSVDLPPVSYDTANVSLSKVLTGRDWLDSDTFTFKIEALDGGPFPKDAQGNEVTEVEVNKENAASFSFGTITFPWSAVVGSLDESKATFFKYRVTEKAGEIPGIAYSGNEATITVHVQYDGAGGLSARAYVENAEFTNSYQKTLSYTAAGGLNVAKTLTGRDMANGQFEIAIVPENEASAAAFGIPLEGVKVDMPAAFDGKQALLNVLDGRDVEFTQADAGETYSYKVYEVADAQAAGYQYDTAVRTVTVTVTDDPTVSALTATTTVSGGPEGEQTFVYTEEGASPSAAVVPFANSYAASTDVPGGTAAPIVATKALFGRDMVAGEFSFGVRLENSELDVLSAKNAADGTVDFGKLSYTTESLASLVRDGHAVKGASSDGKPMWTINYTAYENTEGLADVGITPQRATIGFSVVVVDNGDGTLTATANMPEGGLAFENQYATGGPAVIELSGAKTLQFAEGLTPESITGKFTFTLSSADPVAPMPAGGTTATNDENGNVAFGKISFTLEDLNKALGDAAADTQKADLTSGVAPVDELAPGADPEAVPEVSPTPAKRSYTFVYTVVESGTVAGVTNDSSTKTVSIEVTDDGVGHLTAEIVGVESGKPAFAFVNSYSVDPVSSSVTDQISVAKNLTGRDMAAGEFSFELLEGEDVVATGVNDAAGAVAFGSIAYTEPGTHVYTMREVGAGTTIDGVSYDGATYKIVTTVEDNGKGKLVVSHVAEGAGPDGIVFENAYAAEPTSVIIGASKVLKGKDLAADQFTFKLVGDGVELMAKNKADGSVTFPAISFDKVGTYTFEVSEINDGQANVAYDSAKYSLSVVVSDNGKGNLSAKIISAGDAAVAFTNTYTEPTPSPDGKTSNKVENKVGGGTVAKTGDGALGIAAAFAAITLVAVGTVFVARRARE